MLSDTLNNSQVWGRNFDGQRYPKDYFAACSWDDLQHKMDLKMFGKHHLLTKTCKYRGQV